MNNNGIQKILLEHRKWLLDHSKGKRALLSEADLRGADLRGAYLRGADLSEANLYKADLRGADLSGADLSGANLSGAYLKEADLSGADLSGAKLTFIKGREIYTFTLGKHQGVLVDNDLSIGCQTHSLEHWKEHIVKIGKENNYSDIEIQRYVAMLYILEQMRGFNV